MLNLKQAALCRFATKCRCSLMLACAMGHFMVWVCILTSSRARSFEARGAQSKLARTGSASISSRISAREAPVTQRRTRPTALCTALCGSPRDSLYRRCKCCGTGLMGAVFQSMKKYHSCTKQSDSLVRCLCVFCMYRTPGKQQQRRSGAAWPDTVGRPLLLKEVSPFYIDTRTYSLTSSATSAPLVVSRTVH